MPGMAYADDLVILATSLEAVRRQLERLAEWAEQESMSVNVAKTKAMALAGEWPPQRQWAIAAGQIQLTHSFKYLGITFQRRGDGLLSWTEHLERRAKCGRKAVAGFVSSFCRIRDVTFGTTHDLARSFIPGVLSYGAEVFGGGRKRGSCGPALTER